MPDPTKPFDWQTECPEYAETTQGDVAAVVYARANRLARRAR